MTGFDRRGFLVSSLGAGLAASGMAALSSCSKPSSSGSGKPGDAAQWWEGGQPQTAMDKEIARKHESDLGPVDVTYQENTKLPQALQLAHQSKQMPDVTVIGGLGIPVAQLVSEGWFQPLDLPDDAKPRLEAMGLLEGVHVFDGKTYTFPISTPDPGNVNWYHKHFLDEAGLDPENPPTTYDDFRSACAKIVKGGKTSGLMLPLKVAERNAAQAESLAQASGWAGLNGQMFSTGEFAFDSDEILNYLEFLQSLFTDKLMFAASLNQNVKDGQARWAAGGSAFFWDGPWIPGNIKLNYPQIKGTVKGGPFLTAESSDTLANYTGPAGGGYYIPTDVKHPDVANKIMALLTTEEYQQQYASIMAHLPRDAKAVATAPDVDPAFKDVAESLYKILFFGPDPVVGNQDVAKVDAAIKPVKPGFGEIIQGFFSGDVTDIRGSLRTLSASSTAALESAIKTVTGKGAKVSMDDYAFANWKPGADYTADMYQQR